MADGNWLRLLSGPRSRTPAKPTNSASPPLESSASATTSQQGNPQQPKQDAQQNEQPTGPDAEAIPQRRTHSGHSKALSRLPSWPALSQASSTPTAPKTSTPDLFVREADRVAHNPSMDHIVDTLLAAVMSKPALEPLGPEYGSSILHLIEAYAAAKKEASKAQNELSQAVERRQKENEEFDTLVTEWTIHEARYKAEIKRLEIIIHRTSGSGLEAVTMARSGSLIRRGSRNVTGDQNISPTELENHRRGTTDRGVFKTEASAARHRDSLIGRPRILDPKSDVTLSMKIDKEHLADNVTSIIQTHATIREVPSTPSSKTSSSSSSSDAHGSTKRLSGPALERDRILSGSPSLAAEKQRHQREFSFVEGEDSHMVTQDEVYISDTHSRNENATVKSPHTPLGAMKKDEEQYITNICTTAPGAGEVPPDGMEDGLPQLRRSKEAAQRRFGGKIDADGKAYL